MFVFTSSSLFLKYKNSLATTFSFVSVFSLSSYDLSVLIYLCPARFPFLIFNGHMKAPSNHFFKNFFYKANIERNVLLFNRVPRRDYHQIISSRSFHK